MRLGAEEQGRLTGRAEAVCSGSRASVPEPSVRYQSLLKFDVFLTVDRNLSYQQDLSRFRIGVVVLVAAGNRLADLRPLMPRVLAALPGVKPGEVVLVGG